MKHTSLFFVFIFIYGYDCADRCQTCEDNLPFSTCRLGGDLIVDREDGCPPGKSTCYRIKYVLNINGDEIVKRGCDGPNFCCEQRKRTDISIRRCDLCDEYYCNRGSLK
ncbi:hypothetical protein WA026_007424 [Henosepilachna vigintioctopunctata]|uniref:Uncharacterized protein n=1 Tax=Henosepilachna vigintioctopunctata TaxID=420089 RepID=A0AAW1UVS6_9CUCU